MAQPRLLVLTVLPLLQVGLPEVLAYKAVCLIYGLPKPITMCPITTDNDYHMTHKHLFTGKDGLLSAHLVRYEDGNEVQGRTV